jgi:hypothetical protein
MASEIKVKMIAQSVWCKIWFSQTLQGNTFSELLLLQRNIAPYRFVSLNLTWHNTVYSMTVGPTL